MPRYSPERKAALLKKLLPPLNLSVAELARQEGISEVTLYAWRKQAKAEGAVVPGDKKLPDDWPAEAKFAVVLETAALSEIELSEYCRRKGLYPEQVQAWRQACISGQQSAQAPARMRPARNWACRYAPCNAGPKMTPCKPMREPPRCDRSRATR